MLTAARRRRDRQPAGLSAVLPRASHAAAARRGAAARRTARSTSTGIDARVRGRRAGAACSATRTTRPGACAPRDGARGGRRGRRRARRVGDRRRDPRAADVRRRDVRAVADGGAARRGADVGVEGVQPAGAQARPDRRRAGERLSARTCADHAGYLGRDRGRGGVPRRRRVARRDARDDRRQPARAAVAAAGRGSSSRAARRRASWRGWTAARRGSATIPRRRSSSAAGSRSTRGLDFGAPGAGYARLNVGTTPGAVEEAVRRLAAALTP